MNLIYCVEKSNLQSQVGLGYLLPKKSHANLQTSMLDKDTGYSSQSDS